jgi:hypothetical protein
MGGRPREGMSASSFGAGAGPDAGTEQRGQSCSMFRRVVGPQWRAAPSKPARTSRDLQLCLRHHYVFEDYVDTLYNLIQSSPKKTPKNIIAGVGEERA